MSEISKEAREAAALLWDGGPKDALLQANAEIIQDAIDKAKTEAKATAKCPTCQGTKRVNGFGGCNVDAPRPTCAKATAATESAAV